MAKVLMMSYLCQEVEPAAKTQEAVRKRPAAVMALPPVAEESCPSDLHLQSSALIESSMHNAQMSV